MSAQRPDSIHATVSLVALCFVAVLGIVLASYLTVCSRAMNLSNRSFQSGMAQQLAELGLEEALRAFNKNLLSGSDTTAALADWSAGGVTVNWTLDTGNRRATATVAFASGKFAQGASASVKIRVDNYDAAQSGATWTAGRNYRINDLVGNSGIWYRAITSHLSAGSNQPPNPAYWADAPMPWLWNSNMSYSQYDVVNYAGAWYRCVTANTNSAPPNANWAAIPTLSFSWNSSTTYDPGSFVYSGGTWYRCTNTSTNNAPPNASYWSTGAPYINWAWRYSPAKSYQFNDVVYYNGGWWRCIDAHTANGWWQYPGNPWVTYWEDALTGSMWAWNSAYNYNVGDTAYYSGSWYRCLKANSANAPSGSSAYWTNTPLNSPNWDPGRQYDLNEVVSYNGVWYLSLTASSNYGQAPSATIGSFWIGANTSDTSYQWNAATSYSAGAYRCYGGVWYRAVAASTGKSPNDTGSWSPVGAPVIYSEATVTLPNNPSIAVQLRATIAPVALFPNAIGASSTITITGNSTGKIDSFDGSVSTMNSNGTYGAYAYGQTSTPFSASPDWNKGYSARVAATGTTSPSITIGNLTTVQGYVSAPSSSTPPYDPLTSFGSSAVVQSATSAASPKVDPTRVSRSAFVPQFDPLPRSGLATAFGNADFPKGTSIDTSAGPVLYLGYPGGTTPARYYYNGDLDVGSSYTVSTIHINGPVILYINGYLRVNLNGTVYVNSTGSAEIHVGTYLRVTSGSNGFINRSPSSTSPDTKRLTLIADTSATSAQNYNDTSNDFYGVIYMPNTTATSGLQISSGGSLGVEIFGALSAKNITFGAEANVHYDTSLRYAPLGGVDQPYGVTDWRKLSQSEQATMP